MTRIAKVLGIVVILALTAAGQAANATPQMEPSKPSSAEKALEDTSSLSGKVVETMDAGPKIKVTVGQEIAFGAGIEMDNFPSKTLNRTFEKIFFSGGLLKPQAANKNENEEAAKKAHGGKSLEELKGKEAPSIPLKAPVADNVKVEKATGPNAFTVAELYEKKDALDKQKVVIRGKVVKVSSGIMGKTWVHLRDGSGSAESKTNNLVVTTQDVPDVGDVVTASGTMHKDKDFGAGYLYALIMEEASLLK